MPVLLAREVDVAGEAESIKTELGDCYIPFQDLT